MSLLAEIATSQPVQDWVWSNVDWTHILEKVTLYAALGAGAGVAVVLAVFKVWNVIVEQIGGSKKLWKEKVEGQLQTLAQASESSDTPVTPEIKAKVNDIAAGDGK